MSIKFRLLHLELGTDMQPKAFFTTVSIKFLHQMNIPSDGEVMISLGL